MKNKTLLTIGIPAYNVELFIEDTVLSVAKSKHSDKIEILIINDGSTDKTLEVSKSLEEKYPCVKVVDKPNGGHGSAINSALKHATGKYFRLLDGDDWFDTEEFDCYIEKLESETADIVFTDIVERFLKTGLNRPVNYYSNLPEFTQLPLDTTHFLEWGPMLPTTTIKTDILKKFNLVIDENCYYVDQEYNLACYLAAKTIVYYPFMIYQYRLEREGQSMQKESLIKNVSSHEKVCKRLLSVFHEHSKEMNKIEKKHLSDKIIVPMCHVQYMIAIEYCKSKKHFLSFDNILKRYPEFYNHPGIAGKITKLHRKTKGTLIKMDGIIRRLADKKNSLADNGATRRLLLIISCLALLAIANIIIANNYNSEVFFTNETTIYYEKTSGLVDSINYNFFDGLKTASESTSTNHNIVSAVPMVPFLNIFGISKLSYILTIFNLYILLFAVFMTQTIKHIFNSEKHPVRWWFVPIIFMVFLFLSFTYPPAITNPNIIILTIISLILCLITKTKTVKKIINSTKRIIKKNS